MLLARLFNDSPVELRRKVGWIFALLAAANVAVWAVALAAFHRYPLLLGTAFLAYGFGLRHAVDADHIAAIDNVTRKLMQEGKRPVGVGLFFSLGHSTVVILATLAITATAAAIQTSFPEFKEVGGVIGTSVSALFLLAIAVMNIFVLADVWRTFRAVRKGGAYDDHSFNRMLAQRGLLGRLFRRFFSLVSRSWQMFPLGLLFGLGFDTASEIGLFGISAAEAAKGMPLWCILVFPALFTAGMALVDAADGILMLGAYGWAFVKPIRKLFYNMTITLVSVIVALLVGGIEALGLVADKLGLEGGFWGFVGELADSFGALGYLIIGVFLLAWLVSAAIYRVAGYDAIEVASRTEP